MRPGRRSWSRSSWPPITAMSYLELVTKYPQAAGAALYTHKAFGVHFFTFLVAFTVMCSGITSASTASNAFAGFLNDGFDLDFELGGFGLMLIALGFMALVAAVNFRGVGESVKANVRAHHGRAVRPAADHLRRPVGGHPGQRRLLAGGGLRELRRPRRLLRGHGGDLAGVLRDGRLRGLGQHGRGVHRPGPRLPEGDAHRPRRHRHHLHPGVDHGGRAGAGRRPDRPRRRARRSPRSSQQAHPT